MATWAQAKRWFDTRDTDPSSVGHSVGKLKAGKTVALNVRAIPGGVGPVVDEYSQALWLNVTAVNNDGKGRGNLQVWCPDFEAHHSNVNFGPGDVVANFVPVKIESQPGAKTKRTINIRANGDDVHVVVDVLGVE